MLIAGDIRTFTIPPSAQAAFVVGAATTFINQNGVGVVAIATTGDRPVRKREPTPAAENGLFTPDGGNSELRSYRYI